ncbi:AAA family ATPase [Streptomyces sp. NPDC060085]|uniref:AAA family ATPase n=1 Tax=Streptomyces sp. NPDC060085 TaxID=3347054 RepID=UPI00365C7B58
MTGDAGWHFTGRTALVTQINAFLTTDDWALIVTGQAGSGKSALLARLVTLSDPRFCENSTYCSYLGTIPDALRASVGAVDAAVLARNTDPQELTAALYQAFTGHSPPTSQQASDPLHRYVRTASSRTGRPLTVVVDGIDEARNPHRIITDVLRPLAGLNSQDRHVVQLILGIRSSPPPPRHTPLHDQGSRTERDLLELLREATQALAPLRTDGDSAQEDIAAYAAALLHARSNTRTGPTNATDQVVTDVAEAIAYEVAPSFLDARLAVQQLQARTVLPDPSDPHWRRQLREGTQELLRQDLVDVAQNTQTRPEYHLAVLRATAFAFGAGLPWANVWPAAVRALEPRCGAPEACIRLLRNSRLIGYLTTAIEDGRTVYRPIHERVSETLRSNPSVLLQRQPRRAITTLVSNHIDVHRELTKAFTQLLRNAPLQQPHAYLSRHLISHAKAGGVLDDAHIPASFLPFESQGRIRGALGLSVTPQSATRRLAAWSRIEPYLADTPPEARADSLALAESVSGGHRSPELRSERRIPSLQPRWNQLHLPTNILASTPNDIYALDTFRSVDGSTIVAASHANGALTMWDARTGLTFGAPFTELGRSARSLRAFDDNWIGSNRGIVVGTDAGLWRCDPETGTTSELLRGQVRTLASFQSPEHGPLLAVALPQAVLILDPRTGAVIRRRDADPHRQPVTVHALEAFTLSNGQNLLAMGLDGSHVPLLDAHTLETVAELPGQGLGTAALQAFTTTGGEVRLAIASRSSKGVRIFDPLSGHQQQHARIRQPVAAMTLYPRDHKDPLLVLGSGVDGQITLVDTRDGEVRNHLPAGHTKAVRGLAVLRQTAEHSEGMGTGPSTVGHLLVTGSFDGTIRLWQPKDDEIPGQPMADTSAQHIALLPQVSGPARLVSSNPTAELRLLSRETGLSRPFPGSRQYSGRHITALATASHADDAGPGQLAAAYSDGSIQILTDDGERTVLEEPGRRRTQACTLIFLPNAPSQSRVLAAGFSDGRLAYYNLGAASRVRSHTMRFGGTIRALAAMRSGNENLLAMVAASNVHLLLEGQQPHARLSPHIGSVHSLAFITPVGAHDAVLATGGADGVIRLWDASDPQHEVLQIQNGHRGKVATLVGLQHPGCPQPLLVSASADDTSVRVWEAHTGEEVLRLVTAAPVTSLAVVAGFDQETDEPAIVFGSPRGAGLVVVHL